MAVGVGDLVRSTTGAWIVLAPQHCPNGHEFGADKVLVGYAACSGHRGGHINALSVEFLRRKSADGQPTNELTAASFVLVPANTDAIVLFAKEFGDHLERVIKAASKGGDAAMIQESHDAAGHLGAACIVADDPVDDMSEDGEDGASDGVNKAAALKLRLKALAR